MDKPIYKTVAQDEDKGPARSVEGYVVFITGLHSDTEEDNVLELCEDYGNVTNIHLNYDRRTGNCKGYALVEFEKLDDAQSAVKSLNKAVLLGKELKADFAFKKQASKGKARNK